MTAPRPVALPEPLRVIGGSRSDIATNLETLSSHATRINEGADEKPWEEARVKQFLAGAKNSDLMDVLTGLGFKCGFTDEKTHETTYQHPEVSKPIKIPFPTETIHLAATKGSIDQVAAAIFQFITNQYKVWHTAKPKEMPGEAHRSEIEVMSGKPSFVMV